METPTRMPGAYRATPRTDSSAGAQTSTEAFGQSHGPRVRRGSTLASRYAYPETSTGGLQYTGGAASRPVSSRTGASRTAGGTVGSGSSNSNNNNNLLYYYASDINIGTIELKARALLKHFTDPSGDPNIVPFKSILPYLRVIQKDVGVKFMWTDDERSLIKTINTLSREFLDGIYPVNGIPLDTILSIVKQLVKTAARNAEAQSKAERTAYHSSGSGGISGNGSGARATVSDGYRPSSRLHSSDRHSRSESLASHSSHIPVYVKGGEQHVRFSNEDTHHNHQHQHQHPTSIASSSTSLPPSYTNSRLDATVPSLLTASSSAAASTSVSTGIASTAAHSYNPNAYPTTPGGTRSSIVSSKYSATLKSRLESSDSTSEVNLNRFMSPSAKKFSDYIMSTQRDHAVPSLTTVGSSSTPARESQIPGSFIQLSDTVRKDATTSSQITTTAEDSTSNPRKSLLSDFTSASMNRQSEQGKPPLVGSTNVGLSIGSGSSLNELRRTALDAAQTPKVRNGVIVNEPTLTSSSTLNKTTLYSENMERVESTDTDKLVGFGTSSSGLTDGNHDTGRKIFDFKPTPSTPFASRFGVGGLMTPSRFNLSGRDTSDSGSNLSLENRKEVDKLSHNVHDLQKKLQDAIEKCSGIDKELYENRILINELESKYQRVNDDREKLKKEYETKERILNEEIQKLENGIRNTTSSLDASEFEGRALIFQRDMKRLNENYLNVDDKYAKQSTELANSHRKLRERELELTNTLSNLKRSRAKVSELIRDFDDVRGSLKSEKHENARLREEISILRNAIRESNIELSADTQKALDLIEQQRLKDEIRLSTESHSLRESSNGISMLLAGSKSTASSLETSNSESAILNKVDETQLKIDLSEAIKRVEVIQNENKKLKEIISILHKAEVKISTEAAALKERAKNIEFQYNELMSKVTAPDAGPDSSKIQEKLSLDIESKMRELNYARKEFDESLVNREVNLQRRERQLRELVSEHERLLSDGTEYSLLKKTGMLKYSSPFGSLTGFVIGVLFFVLLLCIKNPQTIVFKVDDLFREGAIIEPM